MGTTESFQPFEYYNSTWFSGAGEAYVYGFAGAAFADISFPNLTYGIETYSSLALTGATFNDFGSGETLYGGGYGSAAKLDLYFGDNYDPDLLWGYLYAELGGSYSCMDTRFYVNDSESHPGFEFYSHGVSAMQNFQITGNGLYYNNNFSNSSNTNVYIENSGLLGLYQSEWILNGWVGNSEVYLDGVFDGLNATIECSDYSTCQIDCLGAHSCYGLTVSCDSTSSCVVDCNMTSGIWCPLGNGYTIGM